MQLDKPLASAWWALRVGLGLAAFLAGLDKFFDLLANWPMYLNPLATRLIPVSADTFMHVAGVVEMAVGVAILTRWTRLGAYVAMVWLACIALSLVTMGAFFDVAVRDLEMAIAAYTLARLTEAHAGEYAHSAVTPRLGRTITVPVVLIGVIAASTLSLHASPAVPRAQAMTGTMSAPSSAVLTLRQNMRRLWSDHVIWTRDYIVAAVGNSADRRAAATRLLKNQDDIGAAVATYYGQPAGAKLTALLKQHITIAVDLIDAARAKDTAKYERVDRAWQQNGDEIADFLSGANPHWPKATLSGMMKTHLATTTKEVVARLTGKWDEDVAAFDEVYAHILMMADALSDGIVAQFPDQFR